jgi:hypothetical protein
LGEEEEKEEEEVVIGVLLMLATKEQSINPRAPAIAASLPFGSMELQTLQFKLRCPRITPNWVLTVARV